MNRKQRNLKYIREKNHYRLGGIGVSCFKVTKEMGEDAEYFDNFLMKDIELNIKKVESIFKIPLKLFRLETGLDGDDFANDLITLKYYYKNEQDKA